MQRRCVVWWPHVAHVFICFRVVVFAVMACVQMTPDLILMIQAALTTLRHGDWSPRLALALALEPVLEPVTSPDASCEATPSWLEPLPPTRPTKMPVMPGQRKRLMTLPPRC